MKNILIVSILFLANLKLFSQEKLQVQQGNTLRYRVTVHNQTFPMFFRLDSLGNDEIRFRFSFEDGRNGVFIMHKGSIDSATNGYWSQPIDGEELVIPASQCLLMLPRLVFSTLIKNNKAAYDGTTFVVKNTVNDFMLQQKAIRIIYIESEAGTKIWIADNPQYPVILKTESNPLAVNVTLESIK